MTEPRTKSFQLEPDLLATIKAWAKRFAKSDSEVIRVALIEGFKSLKLDPSPLKPPRIDPEAIGPPPDPPSKPHKAETWIDTTTGTTGGLTEQVRKAKEEMETEKAATAASDDSKGTKRKPKAK